MNAAPPTDHRASEREGRRLALGAIFEADFVPVSYGFRPKRRAHDAVAEIHYFGTRGYRWVLDADIEACFDSIDHPVLMDRVRSRVTDKRVLLLVKAFLAEVIEQMDDEPIVEALEARLDEWFAEHG